MNTAKKIISCILAAVMVLSVSPLSFAYVTDSDGNPYVEGTDYSYGTGSYVQNAEEISFDTSGTTEVVRMANSSNNCLDGTVSDNVIVAATPSGIAENTGSFVNYYYGGESVVEPVIQMVVKGISDKSKISISEVTCSQINGFSVSTPTITPDTSANTITYTWKVPTGKSANVGDGSSLI